ncbi:MAG TPA: sulfurtransferase [Dermatophilaceae bacterium]|nr:sulfurtransferase [Dermatophilaceae bacterium]
MSRDDVLITPSELRERLAEVRLLDVRWRLGEDPAAGRSRYELAHLPGAGFLDLEAVLTRHTGDPRDGRHPLPDLGELAAALGALGVDEHSEVVVYDEAGSFAAARAWWVLTWAGVRTRVLDGGYAAWRLAGQPVESGVVTMPAVSANLPGGGLTTVDANEAAWAGQDGGQVLVDVRAPERYRGETEPLDPRAGHIPGAVNVPVAGLFDGDGSLPDDETLRERFGEVLDGRRVVAYCGSGVSAAQAVLALRSLGIDAALFPGSWSAWSNEPDRPAATGPDPG